MRSARLWKSHLKTAGLLCFGTLCFAQASEAGTVYLDPYTKSSTQNGSWNYPFKTLSSALYKANGTSSDPYIIKLKYKTSYTDCTGWINKNYVVIDGVGSSVKCTTKTPFQIAQYAHHITIQNFKITAGTASNAGIESQLKSHHITIQNNTVYDSGGGGIHMHGSDYHTIHNNVVYGNAKNMDEHCNSGISLYSMTDYDGETSKYRNRITNNVIYGNINTKNYGTNPNCSHSDGSGIIIDDSRNTQKKWNGTWKDQYGKYHPIPYKGRTLIENNLTMGNGGRGIHIWLSENVTIRQNTAYWNLTDKYAGGWRPGQISVLKSGKVKIYNNALSTKYAKTSLNGEHTGLTVQESVGWVEVRNNVIFVRDYYSYTDKPALEKYIANNGSYSIKYEYNRFVDPKFAKPTQDATANFHPMNTSIYDAGRQWDWSSTGTYDFAGIKRDAPAPTPGAFEK